MNSSLIRNGLVALGIVAILSAALASRRLPEEGRTSSPKPRPTESVSRPLFAPAEAAQSAAAPPAPVPTGTIQAALDDASLRSSYRHYRTALATSNKPGQDALRPKLLKSREAVLRIAESELAAARTPADRDLARLTLESLKD